MFGYSATGSCTMATRPMITMRMEMTMATMGRLMKNLAMGAPPTSTAPGCRRRARASSDLLAGPHPVAALDDHPLAGLQPLGDDPQRADARVDLHLAQLDRVVGADHRDLVDALHILHGALRDEERVLASPRSTARTFAYWPDGARCRGSGTRRARSRCRSSRRPGGRGRPPSRWRDRRCRQPGSAPARCSRGAPGRPAQRRSTARRAAR